MDIFRNPDEVLKETGDGEMRREEEARIKREIEESPEEQDEETEKTEKRPEVRARTTGAAGCRASQPRRSSPAPSTRSA